MGKDTIFSAREVADQQLKAILDQNKELKNANHLKQVEMVNGIADLLQAGYNQSNLASFNPLFQSNIASPLTLNYTFLQYFYKTHGIIQTAIDVPVLDALRGGIDIHSDEIDEDNIKELMDFLEEHAVLGMVGDGKRWARLFGGGAIVVNDGGKFDQPLDENAPIRTLQFYPASRWELSSTQKLSDGKEVTTTRTPWETGASINEEFYLYYGQKLHRSRVLTLNGKEAPWLIRWQLQGWGMSEVERMVEDFNIYLRTRSVLYDLLNEAKTDVFMIEGFRDVLSTADGQQAVLRRIATVQQSKNMNNALLLDKNDQYDQKQITFAGIAEVMKENRIGIASALRMPLTKIFGLSAQGFSSGEEDIENYNAMVESEVRTPLRPVLRKVLNLCMRYLWGETFSYQIKYKPLRVMGAVDEETVRAQKFTRVMAMYNAGLMDSKEVGEACEKGTLIDIDTKAGRGKLEEFPAGPAGTAADLEKDVNQESKGDPKDGAQSKE